MMEDLEHGQSVSMDDATAPQSDDGTQTDAELGDGEGNLQDAGVVEKINIEDVKGLKAEMQFEDKINQITNDQQLLINCYRYIKAHADELKEMLGVDEIKFED